MFYSMLTGGFYDPQIHGASIPSDAVEITTEQHAALLAGQNAGKVIASNSAGYPVLQDQPPPTSAELVTFALAQRNARLAASDWVVLRALEQGQPVPTAWVAYRQALRDVPQQPGYPISIAWPAEPTP